MDKNVCCRVDGWGAEITEITKTGRIKTGYYSNKSVYDIFELFPEIEGADTVHTNGSGSLIFKGDIIIKFQTESDAEKVLNAFKHLKTLCTPEVDPFGN